jgi:3'(2'), 5'-bisphosphate nucleotidase
MMNEQLIQLAISTAIEAGNGILEVYNSEEFGIVSKADDSPLTKADILSHDIIMKGLIDTGIPILSEEGASIDYEERNKWPLLWIVDPIDGTKEFIKRNGEFTVNIALIENQIPILGIVYVPVSGLLFWGAKDYGSFSYIISIQTTHISIDPTYKVPKKSDRKVYSIVASRSHLSKETSDFILEKEKQYGQVETLSKGSSLKLCMVAEGSADCYPRFAPTMEWDTAAGHGVCKYAGCTVIDWATQKEMIYNLKLLRSICYSISLL